MRLIERKDCKMRHENGNCLPCGGFCTAVNDEICEALHNAFSVGEQSKTEWAIEVISEQTTKHAQETLEALRKIHEKVTTHTIEAEPVKHGRWVYDEVEMEWSCSECLREAPVGMSAYILTDYCPHCGAKMDLGG